MPGNRIAIAALAIVVVAVCLQQACAQLPTGTDVRSTACPQAPSIDGRLDPGEWAAAAHYSFSMPMNRLGGAAKPRPAELWVMNSNANLYLAVRVPDAHRNASLSPIKCDLFILAFCKGAALAPGDDRKVLIPGVYADKHVLKPGKDANDKTRNGNGAMRWSDGHWTAEYAVPLNSGDPDDISAKPGDRLKFNLVFVDDFAPKLAGSEVGGLFTSSADDAKDWGSLALDGSAGAEKPAPVPDWLAKLFPYTGEPDEFAHRFRRLDATEVPIGDDFGGKVTVEFLHTTFDGKSEKSQAIIYLPPKLRRDPTARVPYMCNAGYELDEPGALGLVARGWVVSTVHAHPQNPMDRGENLDVALLHAVRALPFVDDSRVMIQGGSAGGYMTLMLAAETFPLICATPMVPPVNWGYNAAYFFHNRAFATATPPGSETPAMPILTAVIPLADEGAKSMGTDTEANSWLMDSPISQLDSITAPIQVLWSTGDMLVPIDQVGAQFVRHAKPGVFPDGFTSDIDALMKRPETRKTLLDLLPRSSYETYVLPLPKGAPSLTTGPQPPPGRAPALELPFSKDHVWSIDVIDEGPKEPLAGHFCYWFAPQYMPFVEWALGRGVVPEQLTTGKLTRLMMRLQGKEYRPATSLPEGATKPIKIVRLDFPQAERADVLRGLIAFAADDAAAKRLGLLYDKLPEDLKALGSALGDTPAAIRATLAKAAAPG